MMEKDDDPAGSTWRWAWRRTREWLKSIAVALIIVPIGAAVIGALTGPASRASVLDHVWWGALPLVGTFIVVTLATGVVALYIAPFEQRRDLVKQIVDRDLQIGTLATRLSLEPVSSGHVATIKRALTAASAAVVGGYPIASQSESDRQVIAGHFSELGQLIDKWDKAAKVWKTKVRVLEDKYDATISSLSLGPPFANAAMKTFFEGAKTKALEQSLDKPYTILWQDDDPRFPGLVRTSSGEGVAQADPMQMALTREAIQTRSQEFMNQMLEWNEIRDYGNFAKEINAFQGKLTLMIMVRNEQDGYVRAGGCPRCPQT